MLLLYAIPRKSQALHRKFTSAPSPSRRATSYWTPEARYGAKGRALLQRAAASGQRSLSSCRWPRQRSLWRRGEVFRYAKASPTRGGGTASAVTERLYEGKPDREPLQRPFTQVWEDTAAPRGASYLAKWENSDTSSCKNTLCQGGNLPISWHSDPTLPKGAECQVGKLAKYNVDILLNSHFAI